MARVKGALNTRKKHNKVLKLAKGFRGGESRIYRTANQGLCVQCRMHISEENAENVISEDFG